MDQNLGATLPTALTCPNKAEGVQRDWLVKLELLFGLVSALPQHANTSNLLRIALTHSFASTSH